MSFRGRRGCRNSCQSSLRNANDNNPVDCFPVAQKPSNLRARGSVYTRCFSRRNARDKIDQRDRIISHSESNSLNATAYDCPREKINSDAVESVHLYAQEDKQDSKSSTIRQGGIIQIPKEVNIYSPIVINDDDISSSGKSGLHSKPVQVVRPHQKKCNNHNSDSRTPYRVAKSTRQADAHDALKQSTNTSTESGFPLFRQSIQQQQPRTSQNPVVGEAAVNILTYFNALNTLMEPPGVCAPHMPPLPDENSQEKSALSKAELLFLRWWFSIKKLRENLFACFETLILHDLNFCFESQVELELWKAIFYNLIELMRGWLNNPFDTELLPVPAEGADMLKIDFEACEGLVKLIKKTLLEDVIERGIERYIELLSSLQQAYRISLDHLLAEGRPAPDSNSRTVILFYLCSQKISLFIGDLARYAESINNTQNFGLARSWYLKAQLIYPKNGRVYNQLGFLSIKMGRPLDAMCYYMRASAASNPFPTAVQTLLALFHEHEDHWNKWARNNPLKGQFHLGTKTKEAKTANEAAHFVAEGMKNKIEIWYHPVNNVVTIVMGMNSLVVPRALLQQRMKEARARRSRSNSSGSLASEEESEEAQADAEEYANIPLLKLTKTFSLYFMHTHGLLFTKIGMETFPDVASTALQALSGLLAQEPCAISCDRLYQILMSNMFNLDRAASLSTAVKSTTAAESEPARSVHHDHAARFALDTFSLICRRATKLFNESKGGPPNSESWLHPDLKVLLPGLRLWTEWMILHPEHWSPPPKYRDPVLRPHLDEWRLVADMCTAASKWISKVKNAPTFEEITPTNDLVVQHYLRKQAEKGQTPIIEGPKYGTLFEETVFAGFKPMLDLIPKLYQYSGDWDSESVEQFIRIEKIVLFGDFLCGIETPVLNFDADNGVYLKAIPEEPDKSEKPQLNNGLGREERTEESVSNGKTIDNNQELQNEMKDDQEDVGDEEFQALRKKRDELRARVESKNRLAEWRAKAEKRTAAGHSRAVEIEVRPVYIVPDTNCYIDWLEGIARLAQVSSNYTLLVPIIVFNELQYLASKARQQSLNPIENAFSEYLVNPTSNTKKGDIIQDRARAAIIYLEGEFERRNPRLRAITAQGNILETIAYRNELDTRQVDQNNDDVILDCCRHLCKEPLGRKAVNVPSQTQPLVLTRQVVLLTGDRTLRIKARTAYVPVTPLRPFVMWSNLKPVVLPREVEELISNALPSDLKVSEGLEPDKKNTRKNRGGRQK
nr:telomerase binding protein EST1A [Hymenolepis microstoma]